MAEPSRQVEVQLGHLCNNRCVFCVSGQLSEQKRAPQLPAEPIERQIREARAAGATKITFLGGEPTIQRTFLHMLQLAVDLDFDEIVLFTNGVMTPRESFRQRVQRVLDQLGPRVRERVIWRFSLQGGDAEHHDATTINPGAWERIQRSMAVLHAEGARITGNMCVVEQNYRSVANLADVAAHFDFENLHLDMVRPRDSGDRTDAELRAMMARYSDMAPQFRALVARCTAELGADFDVNIGNMPFCIAPDLAHKMHHDGEFTVTVAASGQGTTQEGFDKYTDKRSDKHKLPGCADCVFDSRCGGVFDKYGEFYGHDEFAPVNAEHLRGQASGWAHFVLLAEPPLRALAADDSLGLSVGRVDERAATVDLGVRTRGAGQWHLVLSDPRNPGRRGGWARVEGERVAVELVGDFPASDADLSALRAALAHIAGALGGQPPETTVLPKAWQAASAARRTAQQQTRQARQRVAAVAGRLRGQSLGGLDFAGVEKGQDATLTLEWRGDAGRIQLHISAGAGRPRFAHDAEGLDAQQLADFNAALGAALRAPTGRSARG